MNYKSFEKKKMQKLMKELYKQELTKAKPQYPEIPIEITDTTFDSFIAQYPFVIVDCRVSWCAPCKILAPVIEALAKTYAENVVFAKLNTDTERNIANRFGMMSIPTLRFITNGKLMDMIIGVPYQKNISNLQ